MGTIAGWIAAFLFTQAIEIPIYVRAQRGSPASPTLSGRVATAFGASAITHPVVWFVMPAAADAIFLWMARHGLRSLVAGDTFRWLAFGVLAEGFAVAVEALYLRAMRVPRPWSWALVANFASASLGYVSFRLTGWP
ncbi:MAG: hypothetical protein QM820_03010 [Minicystis sp.]